MDTDALFISHYHALKNITKTQQRTKGALQNVIEAANAMLDYECGRIDCGTVSKEIFDIAEKIGYNIDTEEWTA